MQDYLADDIITLRAPEASDVASFMIWENDTKSWRDASTLAPFSRGQLVEYIANYRGDIFAERQLRLVIVDNASDNAIGLVDFFDFDPVNSFCYLGLYVAKDFRGKGIASRAVVLAERYLFSLLHIHQLFVVIGNDNASSLSIFERLGYKKVADIPDRLRRDDGYVSATLFSKISPFNL